MEHLYVKIGFSDVVHKDRQTKRINIVENRPMQLPVASVKLVFSS